MADRPILFSAPMVRALLAGTKTQTRRVLKPQPERTSNGSWLVPWQVGGGSFHAADATDADLAAEMWEGLRIQAGDRLWVRESIDKVTEKGDAEIGYKADWPGDGRGLGWRPSIHMPRWASRLTLTVTDVRVQRLQEISEEDAIAEGMNQATAEAIMCPDELHVFSYAHVATPHALGRIIFETIWEQINGAGAWAANPFVVAYSFAVERRNIDAEG